MWKAFPTENSQLRSVMQVWFLGMNHTEPEGGINNARRLPGFGGGAERSGYLFLSWLWGPDK